MSADLNKPYEVLGVKPGVSVQELKVAHRDLAKVWHPDRFGHDLRLQQKAQEKLKEINEAYDQLISSKTPRQRTAAPHRYSSSRQSRGYNYSTAQSPAEAVTMPSRSSSWLWIVLPLLIFAGVFLVIRHPAQMVQEPARQSELSSPAQKSDQSTSGSANDTGRNRSLVTPDQTRSAKAGEDPVIEPAGEPVRPLPTVTVMTDAETGLLATANCPLKTRMTYPSGNEPHAYCTALHPAKPAESTESRIKSFAKRVSSPTKWLGEDKSKERSDDNNKQDQ